MNVNTTADLRLFRIFVGDESFGLPLEGVEAVVRHELDDASRRTWNYRGATIPLKHLAAELGLPGTPPKQAYVVVVRSDAGLTAWRVDRTAQAKEYRRSEAIPVEGLLKRCCGPGVSRLVRDGEGFLFQLELDRLSEPSARSLPSASRPRDGEVVRAGQVLILRGVANPGERPVSVGIPSTLVREVTALPPIQELHGRGAGLLGLVPRGGSALPVVDAARRLGLPTAAKAPNRLVVVGIPGTTALVGFATAGTVVVRDLPLPHAPCERGFGAMEAMLRGAVELKDETLVVPDFAALLA